MSNGEPWPADLIANQYGGFIYRVICSRVTDRSLVNDVYQDFYLSLVHKPVPPDVRKMESYLYRRIANHIADTYRKIKRHRDLLQNYSEFLKIQGDEDTSSNDYCKEADRVLSKAKNCLSQREYDAIIMKYKQSCAVKDIARSMGVQRESASRYLYKGLRKIRKAVENSSLGQECQDG
ncbi:RNA polymerase sigma factor SigX [Anaerohalosphaera lusitana]|uniref:RNA polymerase sigma factor SigX n=1 Tax=Anaerohalosphaera lusitana TaxID=1936003 RepID=A0A1U9NL75_9BACT|nr:sigma-70 family RNA polymerase sigma factor [Anaerohalosphaera lusitana]AQT68659.1 RNA polymerase sigma factor SigX [Anaerohalosphaera lusitana]